MFIFSGNKSDNFGLGEKNRVHGEKNIRCGEKNMERGEKIIVRGEKIIVHGEKIIRLGEKIIIHYVAVYQCILRNLVVYGGKKLEN